MSIMKIPNEEVCLCKIAGKPREQQCSKPDMKTPPVGIIISLKNMEWHHLFILSVFVFLLRLLKNLLLLVLISFRRYNSV